MSRSIRLWLFPALLVSGLWASGRAQTADNPFEIIPRLTDSLELEADSVLAAPPPAYDTLRATEDTAPEVPPEPAYEDPSALEGLAEDIIAVDPGYRRVKLGVTLLILLVLALMLTVLRSLIRQSVGAFLYANMANQVYREYEGRGFGPFVTLYTLFFLNAGVFLFYLLRFFGIDGGGSPLVQLGYCLAGVTVLFLLKHLILSIIGFVFPVGAEISRYQFIIIIFGITLGIFLVPVNILMAYAPPGLLPVLAYLALSVIGAAYLFRHFRAVLVAWKVLLANKFHFLLYICTIEIAPILFLYQFALDHL